MSYIMEVMVVDSRALIFLLHMPISPSGPSDNCGLKVSLVLFIKQWNEETDEFIKHLVASEIPFDGI